MQRRTTVSKTRRSRSLSRKRPCRFFERSSGRVLRLQTEPAEPSVGQVQMDLLAQPPLRPDAEAIADDQHPDQQLGVDRRPAGRAVEGPDASARRQDRQSRRSRAADGPPARVPRARTRKTVPLLDLPIPIIISLLRNSTESARRLRRNLRVFQRNCTSPGHLDEDSVDADRVQLRRECGVLPDAEEMLHDRRLRWWWLGSVVFACSHGAEHGNCDQSWAAESFHPPVLDRDVPALLVDHLKF